VQDDLIKFEEGLAPETKDNHFLGVAIIVFESSQNVQDFTLIFEDSFLKNSYKWIKAKLCCSRISDEEKAVTLITTYERAPEPTDINWENVSAGNYRKFMHALATYIATLCLIAICFGIIWGINVGKQKL
jgi:hypothetical protein